MFIHKRLQTHVLRPTEEELTGHALLWRSDLGVWGINSRRNSEVTEKFQESGVCVSWLVFIVDVGTGQSRDVQLD